MDSRMCVSPELLLLSPPSVVTVVEANLRNAEMGNSSSSSKHKEPGSQKKGLTKIPDDYGRVILEFGVATDDNPKCRRTMEDSHVLLGRFGNHPNRSYFGVYDGHGGRETVDIIEKILHENIHKEIEASYGKNIEESLKKAFLDTDAGLKNQNTGRSGSTAVSCVFIRSKNNQLEDIRTLYVANAGDSKAILCRGGEAVEITQEHKPSNPIEKERLETSKTPVWITNDKVAGILGVSRSFGDMELKQWVTAAPYTQSILLKPEDAFLIMACDGLWDVCTHQKAVDIVLEHATEKSSALAQRLVNYALENNTKDNLSVIVVKINPFETKLPAATA
ncbi:protein phosphatase 2C-related protein [Planoprotostelium fungivorum]|uniref:Protein phosphatase 2C-related protein n=1 Tax=Planoprotostelium fungivorum TaxID=1890364 RepID=A0A2P6NH49_9EUKA|nr:protein phosphatase 2C-related protein [Planoprotostelium fungivorum]